MEENSPLICDICNVKDLSKCRDQPENIKKHKNKCEAAQKKLKWKRKSAITNFFPKKQPTKKMPALDVQTVEELNVQTVEELDVQTVEELDHSIVDFNMESMGMEVTHDDNADVDVVLVVNKLVDAVLEVEKEIGDLEITLVTNVATTTSTTIKTQTSMTFCNGYIPPGYNVWVNFPFQILDTCNFVISKQKFHAPECAGKNFVMDLNMDGEINWECKMLKNDNSLSRIISRAESDDPTAPIQDKFLTFIQLKTRLDGCREKLSRLSIEKYKLGKKAERLGKTLTFHKRLLIMVAENKIPRLHYLVNVALKNNRSIQYIVGKCTEAIAGVYRARVDQDDKDLTFLVLKFGGPSLLDILYRANVLPSVSLGYRIAKAGAHLHTSVSLSFKECFEKNFKLKFEGDAATDRHGLSIISDETFIHPRLRYNSKTNTTVGVCYEHHHLINLKFNSMDDAHTLQAKLAEDKVHVPKECLVSGISSVLQDIPFQVIVLWPTCSKDDFNGMCKMYADISDAMKLKIDANPLNFNTDGDGTRRQAMHALMKYEVDKNSELGKLLTSLLLLDLKLGKNEETVNFDPKHLVKRCWTSFLSGKLEIGGVLLTKNDLEALLELAERRTHSINSLVYPTDKQSVPHATDCLLSFIEVINDPDKSKKLPFKLTMIQNDLSMVAAVYEGLICLYTYVSSSLTEQTELVAKGAGCLFALFREQSFKIPNQLYHDIQCTYEDVVCSVVKLQIKAPGKSYHTAKSGTDPGERFFGNCRMFSSTTLDAFEFSNSASAISMCDDILLKHPEWVKKGRIARRLVLDHSSCKDWTGDLNVSNVDVISSWKVGLLQAQTLAVRAKYDFDDPTSLSDFGNTLQRPWGRIVGVSEKEYDWSIPEPEVEPPVDEIGDTENDNVEVAEIIDNGDIYLELDGKKVYKASILKQLNKDVPLSADRLRKVRGLSKFVGSENVQANLNDAVSLGDPLIIEHQKKLMVTIVVKILDGDNNKEYIDSSDLEKISIRVVVKELKMKEVGSHLYSTGEYASETITVSGKCCMTVKPEVSLNPPENCSVYYFDKQLIHDIGVHLSLLDANQRSNSSAIPSSVQSTSAASTSSSGSSSSSSSAPAPVASNEVKCKICKKSKILLKDMRSHVGKHIVNNDIGGEKICGFCGKEGCKSVLAKSSSGRGKAFTTPSSDCLYFYAYKQLGKKATRYTPCINRVTTCPVCNVYTWTYNLLAHYKNAHPDEDTNAVKIPDEEIGFLKKSKL